MSEALTILSIATWLLGGAVVYIAIRSGLMRLAASQYRELGRRYELVIADSRLPANDLKGIKFMVRHAFDGWLIWAVVVLLPIAVITSVFMDTEDTLPVDLQRGVGEVFGRTLLGLMAQNPLAGLIIAVEVIVLVAPIEAIRMGTTSRAIERGLARAHYPQGWASA